MTEHAIDIEHLNMTYQLVQTYSVKRNLLRFKKSEKKIIHAVNDVSFTVNKGEVLGIVGKNGSGKSSLLRTIAGIFAPDSGTINLHGNTISLLALGAGFQPEITGRENIYLSGMLLGFSKKEIKEQVNKIIAFSELGDFIDMPVRTYSSGMNSKLAFSITAILETDIILIDETLSVGDTKFRKKSYKKMRNLIEDENRTALIVSHQENTLKDLCDRILWLNDGKVRMIEKPEIVLEQYLTEMR